MMRTALLALLLSACTSSQGIAPPPISDAGRADVSQDAALQKPLPPITGLRELADESPDPGVVEVHLEASPTEAELFPSKMTRVLAFNGSVPGPLIHARVGDRVIIHFHNGLDHGTVIHWHGLRISDQMDGSPRIQSPIPPGGDFTYDFVVPDPGTYWYHPHLGTVEDLERGLYGALVVHEKEPPTFTEERILVVDDVRFDAKFQISGFLRTGPDQMAGRVGNHMLINGRTQTERYSVRRGAIERWRFINAANVRTFTFGISGASFRVIGRDGGLLPAPYTVERFEIAAGQRIELEVRHDVADAKEITLTAYLPYLKDDGSEGLDILPTLVGGIEGEVSAVDPIYPAVTLPRTDVEAMDQKLALSARFGDAGVEFTINGQSAGGHSHGEPMHFAKGKPVRFTIESNVSPEHPFHFHGNFFQVVSRGGKSVNEPGFFDTVRVKGAEPVTILTYFENPGRWMVHCHIAEHTEGGMMTEMVVDP